MDLQQIIERLELNVLTDSRDFTSVHPRGGYTSDLLSCVMAGAKSKYIWVTLQSHLNIVAVAALLDIAAVIITENAHPDHATIAKANEQGVTLLSTSMPNFEVDGKLWEMGLHN
ncbi:MAG: hypothetical protein HYZ21_01160 [Chloroflexi bacterium]|nr:hypothetical protein [Chloroflexota bacterium]